MYLLPSHVEGLSQLLDAPPGVIPKSGNKSRTTKIQTNRNRIPDEVRDEFEKLLDAEYVPFSFQDVRTNEIISFHAFLASLTDDYTASYDSVDGLGRIEPVKVYKSTHRRIGISFHIAATSGDDFEDMWYKINRLLMFVYPQYTEGRDLVVNSEGQQVYQFKAPFSQQPGASPLVRIRLGDLLRSNYSRFSLARLFGAADGTMSLPKDATTQNSAAVKIDSSAVPALQAFKEGKNLPVGTEIKIPEDVINRMKIDKLQVKNAVATIGDPVEGKIDTSKIRPGQTLIKIYTIAERSEGNASTIPKNQYYISNSNIRPTPKAISQEQAKYSSNPDMQSAITAFMNPENNAIVKSFESSGGKGLAGVIESMNFDWYNHVTWDTDTDRTAPKMCKVTLSFSPIHDITPGLDYRGSNRAPVYPVGRKQ
jgi:hypothetical protein